MATHSSALAWRIPWTEESGGLQSMGSQRAGHDWAQPSAVGVLSTESVCWGLWFRIWNGIWMVCYWKPLGRLTRASRARGPWVQLALTTQAGVSKAQPQTKLGWLLIFVNKLVLEQSHGPLATHRLWQLLLYPGRIESFWHIPQGHKAFYSLALCSKLNPSDIEEVGKHSFPRPVVWGRLRTFDKGIFCLGKRAFFLPKNLPGL